MKTDVSSWFLVHGAGRAGRMWRRPTRRLSERYRVLAPDLPSFAGTPGPFTLDAAAAVVIDAAAGDDNRVHLCGLSLGGAVAVRTVSTCPDRFASLVLCAAGAVALAEVGPSWVV